MSIFLCHSSKDSEFVIQVGQHLKRNLGHVFGEVFYYEDHQTADRSFVKTINREVKDCQVMVVFVGGAFTKSKWQITEVEAACAESQKGRDIKFVIVLLPNKDGQPLSFPDEITILNGRPTLKVGKADDACAEKADARGAVAVASSIVTKHLQLPWIGADGLPLDPHLFDYEKDIIDFFTEKLRLGDQVYQPPRTGTAKQKREKEEKRKKMRQMILNGCPAEWPSVERIKPNGGGYDNKLDREDVGQWRQEKARVVAAALSSYHMTDSSAGTVCDSCMLSGGLCFPEAGPREKLAFSGTERLNVAVLVSGGIAPGINAVIDGIVQRHWMYAEAHGYRDDLGIYGLINGFQAFEALPQANRVLVPRAGDRPHDHGLATSEHANEGGSILGTSRVGGLIRPELRLDRLKDIVGKLRGFPIDILYVIGGDGSMKAAHAIWSVAQKEKGRPLSVVAVPKTMDNDILWVWQAFGFLSAVEKAREIIEPLHTEVVSNPRLCVLQLFGSDSGFVVSHAVVASATGHCDAALIPEVPFSMQGLAKHLAKTMQEQRRRTPYGLVVMAETAIPTDAMDFVDTDRRPFVIDFTQDELNAIREFDDRRKKRERIQGQTSDPLRTAGLKIVSRGLAKLLPTTKVKGSGGMRPEWEKLRVFTNEPRHLLRAISPSCTDIIMGQRLGTLAVDNAMAGYTDFMISQWLTEYVLVPLRLVVLGRKRIPSAGIFWKSARAKTGQPKDM